MEPDLPNKKQLKLFTEVKPLKLHDHNNIVRIYAALMSLGNKVLIVPYSVRYDSVKGSYYTVWNSKKCIVTIGLLQLFYFVHSFYQVAIYRRCFNSKSQASLDGSVSKSIKTLVVYMVLFKQLASMRVIWKSKILAPELFAELSRVSDLTTRLCGQFIRKQITSFIYILGAIFFIRLLWEAYKSNTEYRAETSLSFNSFSDYLSSRFYSWYLHDYPPAGDVTYLELLGGAWVSAVSLYADIFDNFVDIWCLTLALVLNFIMGRLTSKLKDGSIKYSQKDEVLELVDYICQLVDLINDTITWIYAGQVVVALPYYAAYLMDMLYAGTGFLFLTNFLFYSFLYLGIFMIAADANSKSRKLSSWLQFRSFKSGVPTEIKHQPLEEQTAIFLSQIQSDAIAIRGGPFFTLTYNFLGNAISFIITYSVIIMQNVKT